ncbi:MAG TPA: flippase, partial [Gammaproteobacteria bacterium]|nr:flippase [Gammaproteobacteria bacterium]
AAPLALLAGLQIINTRVDIIMLGAMRGAAEVAVYNVVSQGAMLASFVLVAATGVISPLVARMYAQGELQQLQRLVTASSRAIFFATLPIAGGMLLFGEPFLSLFGEQYVNGYYALLILLTGQVFNTAFGAVGVLLTMTNHGNLAAKGAAISVVANIILNGVLIPVWGVEGAATASMLTLFLWNILFAFFVYRNIGIRATVVG